MRVRWFALSSLWVACFVPSVFAVTENTIGSRIGFQIHSWNDLRSWPQTLRKGATSFKVDPNFRDANFCATQARANHSDTRGCFVLNHNDPSWLEQRLDYNTTNDLLAFISSEEHRSYFSGPSRIYIALCWKAAPNPCLPTAHSTNWLSLVDSFFEAANEIVAINALNVEFVMDNGVVNACTLQRWRPWVATSGPDDAFMHNDTAQGDDRWEVLNQPWAAVEGPDGDTQADNMHSGANNASELRSGVSCGDFAACAKKRWGKFSNSSYAFQVWEPSDQSQIQAAAEVYIGAGIDHPAGLRYAINIDPAQFEVFSSQETGRGRNELLDLGHNSTARRPQVVALGVVVVVVYQQPNSSWAFRTTGLSKAYSGIPTALPATALTGITAASAVNAASSEMLALFDAHGGGALLALTGGASKESAGLDLVAQFRLTGSNCSAAAVVQTNEQLPSSLLLIQAFTPAPGNMCTLVVQLWTIPVPSLVHGSTLLSPRPVGDPVCIDDSTVQPSSLSVAATRTVPAPTVEAVVAYSAGGLIVATHVELQLGAGQPRINGQPVAGQRGAGARIVVDVGEAVSSAAVLSSSGTSRSLLAIVHGQGYCWNSEARNKDAATGSCDQVPSATDVEGSSVLVYSYGSLSDWKAHLSEAVVDEARGRLGSCNTKLVHGSYDQGRAPAVAVYARSGGSNQFGIVEVHEGYDASAGDKDDNKCGAPISKPGIVLDEWSLAA